MRFLSSEISQSDSSMSLLNHLSELRVRVIYCVVSILICSAISLLFAEDVILTLSEPYGGLLQVIEPTESFAVYLRIGLTIGIALSSPILIYQILAFVTPGLTIREKKMIIFGSFDYFFYTHNINQIIFF